jgi:hypothetical protein
MDSNGIWDGSDQDDEVSAIENGLALLDYYREKYGRDMFTGSAADQLRIVANQQPYWQAIYSRQYRTLNFWEGGTADISNFFGSQTSDFLALAGSRGVFAHEFQHGVSDEEGAADNSSDFVARAINEAISDFFAVAFTSNPCVADDIIESPAGPVLADASPDTFALHPGCGRHIEPDIHVDGYLANWASQDLERRYHSYGVIVSSALFDSRKLATTYEAFEVAVYDAVRFWLRSTPTLIEAREAVVKALKESEQNNEFPATLRPSYYTESQFYENGVGPVPVLASLDSVTPGTKGDLWWASIEGPAGTVFNAKMFAGTGLNNDGSVSGTLDEAVNDPSFTIGADGRLAFQPGQQLFLFHSPDDGHTHSVRVRIPSSSGCCGDLLYYDAYRAPAFLLSVVPAGSGRLPAVPRKFEFRQAVGFSVPGDPQRRAAGASLFRLSVAESDRAARTWNPRYGVTRLLLSVPETAGTVRVRVRIHDMSGRLIREAVDEPLRPGRYLYVWDGRDSRGSRVSPGVYVAVMETTGYRGRAKLVLAR